MNLWRWCAAESPPADALREKLARLSADFSEPAPASRRVLALLQLRADEAEAHELSVILIESPIPPPELQARSAQLHEANDSAERQLRWIEDLLLVAQHLRIAGFGLDDVAPFERDLARRLVLLEQRSRARPDERATALALRVRQAFSW